MSPLSGQPRTRPPRSSFSRELACRVPRGELLEKGSREKPSSVRVPFVVKPCNEDNSRGITLVRREEDAAAAIDYGFSFDSRLVIDEYIDGRELRVACVEEEDG